MPAMCDVPCDAACALSTARTLPQLLRRLCVAVLGGGAAHSVLTYREHGGDLSPLYLLRQFLSSLGNLSSYSNTDKTAIIPLYGYGLAAKAALAAGIVSLTQGTLKVAKVRGACTAPCAAATQMSWPALQAAQSVACGCHGLLKHARRLCALRPALQDGLLLAPLGTLGQAMLPLQGLSFLLAATVRPPQPSPGRTALQAAPCLHAWHSCIPARLQLLALGLVRRRQRCPSRANLPCAITPAGAVHAQGRRRAGPPGRLHLQGAECGCGARRCGGRQYSAAAAAVS